MRTKFKAWTVPYIEEHPEYSLSDEQISELDDFYLEIGCGKGDFILNMARKYPTHRFLGVEKNVTCAGISLKKLVEHKIQNVNFLFRDGFDVVKLIKTGSVNILYLNFSDPWPKKRHSKRRLTYSNFLSEYKRILKKDGLIIFKTDNLDLFSFSLESFNEAGLKVISVDDNYDGLDRDDCPTEYEIRKRNEGFSIKRVVLQND